MSGEVATLKRKIEVWREIIILADSVLSWDKEWYAAVTSGTLSILFLVIWSQEPSMVTLVALLGLLVTLLDFLVPRIQEKMFSKESWSADKEQKLEKICQELVFVRSLGRRLWAALGEYKASSPCVYLLAVIVSLYTLAYLGTIFSGIFLSFMVLLIVCMLPGLHRRGLMQKYCANFILRIEEFVKAKKLE